MHTASVRLLIVNGDVPGVWAPGGRSQDQLFIPADDVHRYMESRRDIWTTARAADEFGVPVETLRYWAESGQVTAEKNRSGYWIFDEASLRQRCEKRRQGDKGLSLTDAGQLLAAPTAGVQAMLHSGILEKAGEDWMGRDRVTRDSVMKARAALVEQRRTCRHRMPKRVNP